nr:S9 family peptidase [Nitritalea halalkaliphila]
MVQYKGENHGLGKLENRKDYSVRMLEFFDHFLKGEEAPEWVTDGIPRLQLEEHLEKRAF